MGLYNGIDGNYLAIPSSDNVTLFKLWPQIKTNINIQPAPAPYGRASSAINACII